MKKITKIILNLAVLGATSLSATSLVKTDGAALFKKCVGCHGLNAEKKALGKSKIIKGWGKNKIIEALKGYKDGSYGGVMKGVMKGQTASLNNEQIEMLAEYISKKSNK